jgi:heme exporter protein D
MRHQPGLAGRDVINQVSGEGAEGPIEGMSRLHDFASFFAMGGYAAFVWPAYGLTALTLVLMLAVTLRSLRARRRIERDLAALGRTRRVPQEARR